MKIIKPKRDCFTSLFKGNPVQNGLLQTMATWNWTLNPWHGKGQANKATVPPRSLPTGHTYYASAAASTRCNCFKKENIPDSVFICNRLFLHSLHKYGENNDYFHNHLKYLVVRIHLHFSTMTLFSTKFLLPFSCNYMPLNLLLDRFYDEAEKNPTYRMLQIYLNLL